MKKFKIILLVLIVGLLGTTAVLYWSLRTGSLQKAMVSEVATKASFDDSQKNLLTDVLGFNGARTYLLLFLNNTELRPGGGFIGVYALLQLDKGTPHLLKVQGTEGFDNFAKVDFESTPPAPIAKYLKLKRWYFRDSNWYPDFASSSQKSIELFLKQGSPVPIEKIDGVVGFTPTVMEEILKIYGPIKINNQEFSAQDFTKQLEYEVEYGYAQRGIDFKDRKSIIGDMAQSLISQIHVSAIKDWPKYYELLQTMLKEKQLVLYFDNQDEQTFVSNRDYSGQMKKSDGDYLLWADANLGALKTDAALVKELSYEITPTGTGKFLATAKMKFIHNGKFDWRTSRYRDYARVYVPVGSQLVNATGAMDMEKSPQPGVVDQGVENGRQWFGTFIAIEPGKIGELSFSYYLPDNIVNTIKNGQYNLLVQKQIGTLDNKLTLGLNFGKNLVGAWPGEGPAKHGDMRYDIETDLRQDREFKVQLSN